MAIHTDDTTALSSRVAALLAAYHDARPEVFAQRAVLVTEAYAASEGRPMLLRRAAALAHILEGVTVLIRDGELVVGCKTPRILGSPLYPEVACDWVEAELDSMETRAEQPFFVSEETKAVLGREVFDYWRGRQVYDRLVQALPAETLTAVDEGLLFHYYLNRTIGHITVDYEQVLRKGFRGLRQEIEAELERVDYEAADSVKKVYLLWAMAQVCEAAIRFASRYAAEAERQAETEDDPLRRAELETIAATCRRVPAEPARTFREAVQAFWFVHLILNLETNAYAIGPGRFDQFMWPYLAADLEADRLTEPETRELLACLWIKCNELTVAKEGGTAKASTTYNDFQQLCLGGVTPEGRDATNRLSYLCLETTAALALPQPQVSVLISERTPERFLREACRVVRRGFGMPALYNDDEKVLALLHKGKSLLDARSGAINGCVEVVAPGTDRMASSGYLNMVKCLELALNDGVNPTTGHRLGPATGEAGTFADFSSFMQAYRTQLAAAVGLKATYDAVARQVYADCCPVPFTSLLIADCMVKGRDYHDGGARYNLPLMCGVGTGTLADSLAAIETLVFEERRLTLPELVDLLRVDFAGHERARRLLVNRAPKWGNGDDRVDSLAAAAVDLFCDELERRHNEQGTPYAADMIPTTTHIWFGDLSGATPDGRHAGTPLSEGISPVQGRDTHGPTAIVRSMARLDHARTAGTLLNMKLHPTAVAGEEALADLAGLVRTYFKLGGHHIQFNVVSAETLWAAQEHPEEYATLIVRVAGYSDYFRRLSRDLQDEIISRTEQML